MCRQLKKYVLLIFAVIGGYCLSFGQAQPRYAYYWPLGKNLGLDFNCEPPRLFKTSALNASNGFSSLSNECGDIDFYCDGDSVWNKLHLPLASGPPALPLNGSKKSTQSSIILPNRQVPGDYFFFTVDDTTLNQFGLSFSILSNASTATGTWTVQNQLLVKGTNEMISAVDHANGLEYWVVTKLKGVNEFRAYKVNGLTGVDTTPVRSFIGNPGDPVPLESGELKFSPNGEFLVMSRPLKIFKFDNTTGAIKDYMDLTDPWIGKGESVTFSADSRFLYFNNYGFSGMQFGFNGIFQADLTITNINDLKRLIIGVSPPFEPKGGMQLGPDGRIYFIEQIDGPSFGVINFPTQSGSSAELVRNAYGGISTVGKFFPNFNQSWVKQNEPFKVSKTCSDQNSMFEINMIEWVPSIGTGKIDKYEWKFDDATAGNADTSTQIKPTYKFPLPGCYNVRLTLTVQGNTFVRTKKIRINPAPTLQLPTRDTSLCVRPRIITLFASTPDNPTATYEWYYDTLGAPPADPDLNPKFPIANTDFFKADIEGTYWIKKSWNCCDIWDTITVNFDSIVPNFKINDNLQCLKDNNFVFTNISKPSIKSTSWDFGPGGKKTGTTASATFNQTGAYYPVMSTGSEKGCKSTLTRIILVVKHPEARFFADTTKLCQNGNIFKLRDSSTIEFGQGGLEEWDFDLGDSTRTKLKQFTKSYAKPGTYNVRLVVTSSQECRDTARKTLQVFEQPKAGFAVDNNNQCLSANNFVFTDTSKSATDSINYRHWLYGDGSPQDNRTSLPLTFGRKFTSVDSFLISLKVGTGIGCFDTSKQYVYVHDDPYVDFSTATPQQCLEGNLYTFKDTTFAKNGFVQTRIWDFGDSTPLSSTGVNKSFKTYGGYNVKLKVITNKGCTDSVSKPVLVNPMPSAAFTVNNSITCFKDHSFVLSSAPSFISVGTINSYAWDFGDGNTTTQKDPLPKTYTKDSLHKVVLILVSDKGCADTAQRVLQFHPTPEAKVSVDKPIQCLEENLFKYSSAGTTANGGTISEYLWEFGDGTIDIGAIPNGKFYINPDTFNVVLKITTDKGCTDTASIVVGLLPSPQANFSVSPTCLFQPSKFVDNSSSNPGSITSRNWQLGDGTLTNDTNPIHTYNNAGNYTVTLNVQSNFGCAASVTKVNEAVVKPLPQAKFGFIKTEFDDKNTTIQFLDSSIDADSWQWDLGKNNNSVLQNPLIVYGDTATLPIRLIIGNNKGCFDTITKNIFIAPDFYFHVPNAFSPNKDVLNPTFGGEGTRYFKEYNLKIFNRWGQKIFESENALNKWDGTYKGEDCPEGQYTFIYRLRDVYGFYHNYKGDLTLFR